jgi:2-polyprenyl-3-methyl-5-hydroxy-6-metoxy-1,4-benzoquinol methylase
LVARSLGWFVRDQVTFNRQTMICVEAALEALNELNSSISILAGEFNTRMAGQTRRVIEEAAALKEESIELKDIRTRWRDWSAHWEKTNATNEMNFLRSVADLQTGFSHRANQMESNFRDIVKAQHNDYLGALERTDLAIQKKMWADLDRIRNEYEGIIHTELRVVRQRAFAASAVHTPVAPAVTPDAGFDTQFDYGWFAERFRGPEEYVRRNQEFYLPYFQEAGSVLDLGCGRGEFLQLLRERNIRGRGVESSDQNVIYCRSKGLDVEKGDLFQFLTDLPEQAEDAIFASQVVEHLPPSRLPELVRLCASRLRKGGVLAFETPNPECLAIFAMQFYLDPTHQRPVPYELLNFCMRESGMGNIKVHRLSPAAETYPEIKLLPEPFAGKFFGGMDYSILGFKL